MSIESLGARPTFPAAYGPWAVVTGASSGIGEHVAELLAYGGKNVVLVARRADALEALATRLRGTHGVQVRVLAMDLGVPGASTSLDGATADLDVGLVVLNAGFGTSGPFLGADLREEEAMIALNCAALTGGALLFGRRLATRKAGALVLVSSILAFTGVPRAATYAASKAYVQSLGEALRLELGERGVDVLTVAPGPTVTGFADRARMTMGAAMTPAQVARSVVAALGGRGTRFPGWLSKLLWALTGPLPRWMATRIFAGVMAGMTRPSPR